MHTSPYLMVAGCGQFTFSCVRVFSFHFANELTGKREIEKAKLRNWKIRKLGNRKIEKARNREIEILRKLKREIEKFISRFRFLDFSISWFLDFSIPRFPDFSIFRFRFLDLPISRFRFCKRRKRENAKTQNSLKDILCFIVWCKPISSRTFH